MEREIRENGITTYKTSIADPQGRRPPWEGRFRCRCLLSPAEWDAIEGWHRAARRACSNRVLCRHLRARKS
jgi:hypothetical protein